MSSKTSSRPRGAAAGPTPPVSNGKQQQQQQNAWARPLQPAAAAAATTTASSVPKGPPPGMGAPAILRERFLHLTLSMVGQRVVVTKVDGKVVEGVFHTFTPFSSHSDEYRNKYVLKACKGSGVPSVGATIILDASDVSQVHVKSMRLDAATTASGTSTPTASSAANGDYVRTDVEISALQSDKSRELVAAGSAWTSAPQPSSTTNSRAEGLMDGGTTSHRGGAAAGTGGLKGHIGEWDQFKANEKLFNVQASFDENLYTTELDHSQIDLRKKKEAERLAKEIENTTSSNIHISEERGHKIEGDYDEEDRYSGVLKPSLQPRNVNPKRNAKQSPVTPAASTKPKSAPSSPGEKVATSPPVEGAKTTTTEDSAKPAAAPAKMNYAAAAAKAKADAKAAIPPGFVKPALVSPGSKEEDAASVKVDQEKAEENGVSGRNRDETEPTTVTPVVKDVKDEEASERTDGEAKAEEVREQEGEEEESKPAEEKEEKKQEPTKLNANAKSFSFNPTAKSFTPSFGGSAGPPAAAAAPPPMDAYPADPNMGMPMGGPGAPPMPAQYMPHPGMAQPGMVPMMNAHYVPMRYPTGPYPGMEHQMPVPVPPQQPQHAQQQPPPAPGSQQPSAPGSQQPSAPTSIDGGSPAPPVSGDDASEGTAPPMPLQQQQHQQAPPPQPQQAMGQPAMQPMPYPAGGPPGSYYPSPGMMPPHRGAPGGYPPQMGPPGGNPYGHPMYGGPMPMAPNMMRGPQGNYYPPMGGMHYQPGAYGGGTMDDDQGYRGGRGGRGGRGPPSRRNSRKGGRGGGRGNYSYSSGGSGRQTPQSSSGVSDNGEGTTGESKPASSSPSSSPKPSAEE